MCHRLSALTAGKSEDGLLKCNSVSPTGAHIIALVLATVSANLRFLFEQKLALKDPIHSYL